MKIHPQKKNRKYRRLKLATTILVSIVFIYTLVKVSKSYAIVPDYAKFSDVKGPNTLGHRDSSGTFKPAPIGTILKKIRELLTLDHKNQTFARLDFYNNPDKPLDLAVQASTKNELLTHYYFPCSIQGEFIIEWSNPEGAKEVGCQEGIRLKPGIPFKSSTQLPNKKYTYAFQELKQLKVAQGSRRGFRYYCTVNASNGSGWIGVTKSSNNPCQEPIEQCNASASGECNAVTLDSWNVREQDLTALVVCDRNQVFTGKGTGSAMEELVNKTWQQATNQRATSCALRVIGSRDVLVSPLPSDNKTLIQTRNTNVGTVVEVIEGKAVVRTAKRPEGVTLNRGKKYTYFGESANDPIGNFDPTEESVALGCFRNTSNCNLRTREPDSPGPVIIKDPNTIPRPIPTRRSTPESTPTAPSTYPSTAPYPSSTPI